MNQQHRVMITALGVLFFAFLVTRATTSKPEDTKQPMVGRKRATFVMHQVFLANCVNAIPKNGSPEEKTRHTLKLMSSHFFPMCMAYECRYLLRLPFAICDSIAVQAERLGKRAKLYQKRWRIARMEQESANLVITF